MAARNLKDRLADARKDESGATLILMAFLLIVFMGMAAFAVDLGWLYWNGIKIQHGADAAALAGVIYEPADKTTAYSEAKNSASENGYVDANAGTTVTPGDFSESPPPVDNENQLAVTVSYEVPTFFMSVFGIDSVTISKRAVAEYALPLAMGSDVPYFGEDPTDSSRNPNYWGNIHGYYTGRKMGDRFASQCNSGGSQKDCTPNPEARPTVWRDNNGKDDYTGGYLYGIEVPAGASGLKVEIFDGPFYRGGNDYILTGDQPQSGSSTGPTTLFMLYGPDPTPLNTTDGNELLCVVEYAPQDPFADFNNDGSVNTGDDQNTDGKLDWTDVAIGLAAKDQLTEPPPYSLADLWDEMCPSTNLDKGPGIYPLRVVVKKPANSDDDRGLNRYSMRSSTTTGSQPRFYGLGDMAIYVNFSGNQATFNFAEVSEVHKGKELVIELWDPDSGNNGIKVTDPSGNVPQCYWTSTDGRSGGTATNPIPCDYSYSPGFNDAHMQIRIAIPSTYTCPSSGCWWNITIDYPGGANDTTTWSARIEGNPVRLVE